MLCAYHGARPRASRFHYVSPVLLGLLVLAAGAALAATPVSPLPDDGTLPPAPVREHHAIDKALGDPVDFAAALADGGAYLVHAQADVTEDNAGNGTDGVDETPDDPDDGGWDWRLTDPDFTHSTAASPKNIYGATAQGLLAAYLVSGDAALMTAMTDAADAMAGDADIRSAGDLLFLMNYNDLPAVGGTTYMDAAKAKFDGRISSYGTATALAEYIRDVRNSQGYGNGIIAWDIGAWAVAAAMLADRYPGDPYDYAQAADDIAEVVWQDSFNDNPGYFDVIDDQGFDPTYTDKNFWWYNLGISGLIDAFRASGSHTAEIPGLVTIMLAGQHSDGGVDDSYGVNPDNEDWQTTAYCALSLAAYDQVTHQDQISKMAYWLGATQHASGGWVYASSGNHYPEIGGECTAAVALGAAPSDCLVDDGFASQTDVDVYNAANGTSYVFGYDAFATIQAAVDAVEGSSVTVLDGTYEEQVTVAADLTITGVGDVTITAPTTLTDSFATGSNNNFPIVFAHDCDLVLSNVAVDGLGRGNGNYRFVGIGLWNAGGTLSDISITGIRETPFSGNQHGIALYVNNQDAASRTLTVTDAAIDDYQKGGVAVTGGGMMVDLTRVSCTGAGITSTIAMNGIQVGGGSGGSLTDCTVGGHYWDGATWTSAGYLFQYGAPITMTGCVSSADQTCVYALNTDLAADGCDFTGENGALDYYGVLAYGYAAKFGKEGRAPVPAQGVDEAAGDPVKATYVCALSDCTFTGQNIAGTSGVLAYGGGEDVDLSMTGCVVTGWEWGVSTWEDTSTVTAACPTNAIFGNTTYGFESNLAAAADATYCWWGDPSGPYHPTANPLGLGDEVTDNVDFAPYSSGNLVCVPDPLLISLDDGGPPYVDTTVCRYLGGGSGGIYGYSIEVTWDSGVVSASTSSFTRPDSGPFATAPLFFVLPITGGVRIDAGLGGATPGIDAGELFKAAFTAVGTPGYATSALDVTILNLREGDNTPVTGVTEDDGLVIVDLGAPSVADVLITNDTLAHTDDYIKDGDQATVTATVGDGDPGFDADNITADLSGLGGSAAAPPDSYVGGVATWTLTAVTTTPSDGTVTVTVTAEDPLGNTTTGSDDIIADNTAPTPVTGLASTTGHEKVNLTWNDAAGNDTWFDGVVIRYVAWGDYPDYATTAPAYPADETAGDGSAYDGTGAATTHAIVARDIYYYSAFVYDIARNYSALDGGGGSSTRRYNYWLGDVSDGFTYGLYDGYVDGADITQLGASYGLDEGDVGFKNEVDVGATDDSSRLGFPLPDDSVNFEDLMIFSMNYGVVGPAKTGPVPGSHVPLLALERVDDATWSLVLVEPCSDLKGICLRADLPAGVRATVTGGALLAEQEDPVFLRNIDRRGLDAGLALLGTDRVIAGSGELLRVTLSQPAALGEVTVLARGRDNNEHVVDLESATGVELPTVFAMGPNYPNPFNPSTTFRFDLPEAQHVRLAVYAVDGSLVASVLDETRPAGQHAVSWHGRDAAGRAVASGTYFARLEAGPYRKIVKMVLMK